MPAVVVEIPSKVSSFSALCSPPPTAAAQTNTQFIFRFWQIKQWEVRMFAWSQGQGGAGLVQGPCRLSALGLIEYLWWRPGGKLHSNISNSAVFMLEHVYICTFMPWWMIIHTLWHCSVFVPVTSHRICVSIRWCCWIWHQTRHPPHKR